MESRRRRDGDPAPAAPNFPAAGMDRKQLLAAASGMCGANRAAATALGAILKRLVADTGNWPTQARRLDRLGLSARHLIAPLRHILDLPGDLAVLQLTPDTYLLLQRHEERWQVIGADGEAVADVSDAAGDALMEAIVLRMPFANLGRMASVRWSRCGRRCARPGRKSALPACSSTSDSCCCRSLPWWSTTRSSTTAYSKPCGP
jgi:hypothetical protein